MAFVTLNEIQHYIPEGLESYFRREPSVFTSVEAEAGNIVMRISGIASTPTPDWIVPNMANIITYLSAQKLSLSPELLSLINQKYKETIAFLQTVTTRGETTEIEYAACSTITGAITW